MIVINIHKIRITGLDCRYISINTVFHIQDRQTYISQHCPSNFINYLFLMRSSSTMCHVREFCTKTI